MTNDFNKKDYYANVGIYIGIVTLDMYKISIKIWTKLTKTDLQQVIIFMW